MDLLPFNHNYCFTEDVKTLSDVDWVLALMTWAQESTQDIVDDEITPNIEQLWERGFQRLLRMDLGSILWMVLEEEVHFKLVNDLREYIKSQYPKNDYESIVVDAYNNYTNRGSEMLAEKHKLLIEATSEEELLTIYREINELKSNMKRWVTPVKVLTTKADFHNFH